MSREEYTPTNLNATTSITSAAGNNSQTVGYTGFNLSTGGTSQFEDTSRPVQYLCGDCDNKVTLKKGDPIRCKECGYRVLYKERTNRMVQFEAR